MIRGNQILLGQIVKVANYDGTVAVKLSQQFTDIFRYSVLLFIETEGKLVPFFISEYEFSGKDTLRVKFNGYESDTKVSEFVGCNIYLPTAPDGSLRGKEEDDISGYTAFLKNNEVIGTVSVMIENPGQWLLSVITPGGKEILVPYHDDLIISIDSRKKTIVLDLPEGLADIN
ncbi:MAG: ribosome maturation factor RimM [Bacteroidales bacterium]|jgi:16S rRNA processing protein RimM|nr:ribosome maturation factor RimM [Bacteroidales bacterium]